MRLMASNVFRSSATVVLVLFSKCNGEFLCPKHGLLVSVVNRLRYAPLCQTMRAVEESFVAVHLSFIIKQIN